jgi:hypothetical protein
MTGQWCYLDPICWHNGLSENCIDMDFLNNDQDRLVVNGRDHLNQIGALTPVLNSAGSNGIVHIAGVEVMSIDCDLTDRIIYVEFDDSVLPVSGYPHYFPMRTDVANGADTEFYVYDISEGAHIGTSYDLGTQIWAIDTDANDDIWVLDEDLYVHHFVNNGDSYTEHAETSFDILQTVPDFEGVVYDFVIDFYNEALYILTNGSAYGMLYRIECDGEYKNPIEGSPNPLVGVWDHSVNDRADIIIDNLNSSGNVLQGEQDAQIVCFGNLPGNQFPPNSEGASKIGVTRVDAALGSVVRYEFLGGTYYGYGACAAAINQRTNACYVKNGPPYGNQYIIHKFYVPPAEWY